MLNHMKLRRIKRETLIWCVVSAGGSLNKREGSETCQHESSHAKHKQNKAKQVLRVLKWPHVHLGTQKGKNRYPVLKKFRFCLSSI